MTSATPAFPCIEISGSPYERGISYGQQARERVLRSVALYGGQLHKFGLSSETLAEILSAFLPRIEAFNGDVVEEMRGIAKGAEVPFSDILLINMRTELLHMAKTKTALTKPAEPEDGCTGIIALDTATTDGEVIHAQNWDWRAECVDNSVVLIVRRDNGPDVMTFTEAGGLARNGMNSVGTAITANFLESDQDYREIGIPLPLIRRAALEEPLFANSLRTIADTPKSGSNNMMLSHADGFGINLECAPDRTFKIHTQDDVVVHANHWLSPIALGLLRDTAPTSSTVYRYWRVDRHLRKALGRIDEGVAKAALGDRFGWPQAVCRPPIENEPSNLSATVATVVMKAKAGWMDVAPLPALGNPFTRYQLTPDMSGRAAALVS